MKKILIIHNKYRESGGEDIAVSNEISLLNEHFEVKVLYFNNSINNYLTQAISFLFNKNTESQKILNLEIKKFKPDYAYVHNTWFKASIGIFETLKVNNVNVILKLHNYRHFCTASFSSKKHLSGDEICKACGFQKESSRIFNKYFIDSHFKSLLVNYYGRRYSKILKYENIKILVLTEFHKAFLKKLKIEENKIFVLPNFIDIDKSIRKLNDDLFIIYAGRVSEEKGVEELIKTYLNLKDKKFKLKIAGEGPELNYLKTKYIDENVEFLGYIKNDKVLDLISQSIGVVTATKLYEGQPTILCEASSIGVASIFPRSGGISEFFPIDYKLSFEQFNYDDLLIKLNLMNDENNIRKQGNLVKKYISNYLEKQKLISKFEKVLDEF
tara:strand:- start:1069 stop:2220 length:1152 start_codon:yes stop_codon:yes gene_type:complete